MKNDENRVLTLWKTGDKIRNVNKTNKKAHKENKQNKKSTLQVHFPIYKTSNKQKTNQQLPRRRS